MAFGGRVLGGPIFQKLTYIASMNYGIILRFGSLLGFFSSAAMLITYLVNLAWMVSGWNSLVSVALLLGAMALGCLEDRRFHEQQYAYGRAVVTALGIGVVGSLIGILFTGLLYNVIDQDLHVRVKELMATEMEESLGSFGMEDAEVDKAMEAFEARSFQQDWKALGTAFMLSVLMNFFFALVVGLFVRRRIRDPFSDASAG